MRVPRAVGRVASCPEALSSDADVDADGEGVSSAAATAIVCGALRDRPTRKAAAPTRALNPAAPISHPTTSRYVSVRVCLQT